MRADLADLKCVCDEIARVIKSAESNKIAESGAIFLLNGDIGAGKTTLVREFAKYVGISDSVTSPTFSLLHIYGAESRLDSADSQNLVKNNPSLRDSAKQNRGNPPIKKTQNLQGRLPRSHSLARNDDSFLDSADSQNLKIYHYDLFNRNLCELLDLGLLDLLEQRGIHFVEWGDERLFNIIKNAFENIFIIQITKAKNDRIYEFKSEF